MSLGGQDLFGPNAQKSRNGERTPRRNRSRWYLECSRRDKTGIKLPGRSLLLLLLLLPDRPGHCHISHLWTLFISQNPTILISTLLAIPFEGMQANSRPTESVLLPLPKDILMPRTESLPRNSPGQVAVTSPQDRAPPGKTRTKDHNNIVPSPRKGGAEEEAINEDRMGSLQHFFTGHWSYTATTGPPTFFKLWRSSWTLTPSKKWRIPRPQGFYSRLFLVPKPDGSFRPIIDLKKLNLFLEILSFKMGTLFSIIAALQPQEWITKIDLKDTYHHILVHVNIHKYFRFGWKDLRSPVWSLNAPPPARFHQHIKH